MNIPYVMVTAAGIEPAQHELMRFGVEPTPHAAAFYLFG